MEKAIEAPVSPLSMFYHRWSTPILIVGGLALGTIFLLLLWGQNITTSLLAGAVRQSTPLVLGALCGLKRSSDDKAISPVGCHCNGVAFFKQGTVNKFSADD